jgi:hypothetical protein
MAEGVAVVTTYSHFTLCCQKLLVLLLLLLLLLLLRLQAFRDEQSGGDYASVRGLPGGKAAGP